MNEGVVVLSFVESRCIFSPEFTHQQKNLTSVNNLKIDESDNVHVVSSKEKTMLWSITLGARVRPLFTL